MGVFVQFTDGLASMKFNVNPTSILVPPVEDQSFLRGLIAGSGISSTGGDIRRLVLRRQRLHPRPEHQHGQPPEGVSQTGLSPGPRSA